MVDLRYCSKETLLLALRRRGISEISTITAQRYHELIVSTWGGLHYPVKSEQ